MVGKTKLSKFSASQTIVARNSHNPLYCKAVNELLIKSKQTNAQETTNTTQTINPSPINPSPINSSPTKTRSRTQNNGTAKRKREDMNVTEPSPIKTRSRTQNNSNTEETRNGTTKRSKKCKQNDLKIAKTQNFRSPIKARTQTNKNDGH